jgi:hypothetical protein
MEILAVASELRHGLIVALWVMAVENLFIFNRLAFGALVLGSVSVFGNAQACGQGISRKVDIYVVRMPVSEVFGLVSERAGLTIAVNDIGGEVGNMRLTGSVSSVLSKLAQRNGLIWWCEPGIVRIANASTRTTCVIQNGRIGRELLRQTSLALGIDTRRVTFSPVSGGVYLVSGPNELMTNITSAARAIADKAPRVGVTVYRGGQANLDLPPAPVSGDPVTCP